ncbi:class E sortase [Arthrobacter sp. UM1]|uniref:class E sortase n=1 Tax=Arthrobacter sp. UM1 TaxID=2766776 RepID=UPI001CF6DF13|nr:class E sortase [Arthrobacter sp. UM1]MCB4209220.1 class E sortase [Arthrobacter sp. UM1]
MPHGASTARSPRRLPRRPSIREIIGETLLLLGLVVVLFVAWRLWWTNVVDGSRQEAEAHRIEQRFASDRSAQTAPEPASRSLKLGSGIAVVYIPRFGPQYSRPVLEGVGADVLDTLGLGHYPGTAGPGGLGNFALAGHRQTHGAVLDNIDQLRAGDSVYVRTARGYYRYRFESARIVLPSETSVLAADPLHPGAAPTHRYLTLTSCHPRFGDSHRYIVRAELSGFTPASASPPAEIAAAVGSAHHGKESPS